jgi:hypothetical protein
MALAHSARAPLDIYRPEPVGICDRCDFKYPLARLTEQRQWAGAGTVGLGLRCCPRCLDELQQNGFRTIIIGPEGVPPPHARPGSLFARMGAGPAPQFVLEDVQVNAPDVSVWLLTETGQLLGTETDAQLFCFDNTTATSAMLIAPDDMLTETGQSLVTESGQPFVTD